MGKNIYGYYFGQVRDKIQSLGRDEIITIIIFVLGIISGAIFGLLDIQIIEPFFKFLGIEI